ncbi:serine/threonine protein kinase [Planktothrix sp. FACHB-1355]|uniref:non-specific serine/threonine protein kinase n=1 Tax=Aerosakkonema funiforme FACHB-1375 TaxID=2949571 RepID=A0A926VL05_9CYAN|nr:MULTISPECIES: serine/threonine-protein kinase [Oscillatoriales]MBD2185845.1 serine/threonine protein kinase [Aerosakkonema funiforme FACHB-1375]MBD3558543.1 serine/threonine protein kinase [Planktothrix sp. FACHB-1355]
MELLHQPGDAIAQRYQIVNTLGQGGIGITYEAIDLHSNQRVALKELSFRRVSQWKVLELFEREAKILSHLNHPSIPRYLDYFQVDTPEDCRFYLVQELAEGRSLSSLVESGWRGKESEVRRLAVQVLEILTYLQEFAPPVIHRDIKPQNIIQREDGQIFLVDFGAVQDTYRQTVTGGSTVIGTYGYMAPEQFRGQAYPSTDLYGLGATLLFLLTHRSTVDLPQHRLKIDFRSQVEISDEFADWLETMLEPVPEDRFSSAKDALANLRGEHTITVQKRRKPAGSRIVLQNTGQRLVVEIPPSGWQFQNISWLGFALIWSGFLFFWTAGAIAVGAYLFFPLLSIPFWIVGLGMLGGVLFSVAGRTRLEIDRENFRLQWKLFAFSHQIRGRTQDIDRVDLCSNFEVNNKPVMACTIVEGVRTHSFGSWLAQSEKEWLREELTNYLGKKLS